MQRIPEANSCARTGQIKRRRLVGLAETSDRLGGLCRATLYRLINSGKLVRVKVCDRTLILESSIEALIDAGIAAK